MDKYGKKNVNAIKSNGDLDVLLENMNNKLVQILVCEDITSRPQTKESINKFNAMSLVLKKT